MKKFLALLKVSLLAMLTTTVGSGKKKKKLSGVGLALLLAGIALYVSGVYSWMLLEVLAPLGMESLVLIYMGLAALITGLLFSAFGVSSVLFGGKDNDLMLSMPVSPTMLALSRVAAIYVENLLLSFFMLIPAGVACGIMTQGTAGRTVGFWLRMLTVVISLPLLDTALSVLVGALLAWASKKITSKALGRNLIMGAYLALVFWFSFNLSSGIQGLATRAESAKAGLSWAAPIVWMADGVMGDWGLIGQFVLSCVAPFALVVWGLGKAFRKAVTAFSEVKARSDYRLSDQRSMGQARTLLAMEVKRFVGTTVYFWNAGLGFILLLVLGVAAIIKRDLVLETVAMIGVPELLLPVACAVMGFCLSTGAIVAPSYSLEGKQMWILRSAPVSSRSIIWLKTSFQWLIAMPCILICVLCLGFALEMGAVRMAVLLACTVSFEILHALFGSLIGMAFGRLDVNPSQAVKQSLVGFLSIMAPMVALVGLGALVYWFSGWWTMQTSLLAVSGLMLVLSAVLALVLDKKGPGMLERMK